MKYLGNMRVVPRLPDKISRLKDFAYNLYFSWHPEVRDLFIEIDRNLWKKTNHNPVKFLNEVQQKKLEEFSKNDNFLKKYGHVLNQFDDYLDEKKTWFQQNFPNEKKLLIGYFTAEFGLHESLPIYAGGLGVLAGDHIKSSSDLGIPIVGVSLFYNQTYFSQEIDAQGNQIAKYCKLNPYELPLKLIRNPDDSPLLVEVHVANRKVFIQIWEAKVGRRSVYLLDSNVLKNSANDREITSRLYGGDQEMRISQEIILGMGGVQALKALNITPNVWHMNEGHSVFMALQRIKDLVHATDVNFDEAMEAVSANTVFTTHTPVPAGNDAFPLPIKDKYFQEYWESVGIRRHQFMELGSQVQPEGYEIFNLTILALNLSRFRNGVSKLHGEISRNLWRTVWPDLPTVEVPITHITNGVHTLSWVARKNRELFDEYVGKDWQMNYDDSELWKSLEKIPPEVLWQTKLEIKKKMLNHVKDRLEHQFYRNKFGSLQLLRMRQLIRTDALTIGFARRFATYKRGTLIFRNQERLSRILNDPNKPVQLIFAGKAHPKDGGGQELIRQIYEYSLSSEFRGKVLFVENYDMGLARDLVSGMDVWLNNPRRTQEASGTSGQKVGMNGGVNFSVLDGWWCEGYNGKNGWAFGDQEEPDSFEDWDSWDSEELYDIIENDIVPMFYDRDENNIPIKWVERMINSMQTIIPAFNTNRMVKQYVSNMYQPALDLGMQYSADNYQTARDIAKWKEKIDLHWSEAAIIPVEKKVLQNNSIILNFGESREFEAHVKLGSLSPDEVKVQLYITQNNGSSVFGFETFDMEMVKKNSNGIYLYKAVIKPSDSGNYQYTLRLIPYHKHQANPVEYGLAKWYEG